MRPISPSFSFKTEQIKLMGKCNFVLKFLQQIPRNKNFVLRFKFEHISCIFLDFYVRWTHPVPRYFSKSQNFDISETN